MVRLPKSRGSTRLGSEQSRRHHHSQCFQIKKKLETILCCSVVDDTMLWTLRMIPPAADHVYTLWQVAQAGSAGLSFVQNQHVFRLWFASTAVVRTEPPFTPSSVNGARRRAPAAPEDRINLHPAPPTFWKSARTWMPMRDLSSWDFPGDDEPRICFIFLLLKYETEFR